MSKSSPILAALQSAFERPTDGVVGLVDELLKLSRQGAIQLEWRDERCRVRSLADNAIEVIETPLRKSVFRAILARLAALCNERKADSVSFYGGQGFSGTRADPASLVQVSFANTQEEQWCKIEPLAQAAPPVEPSPISLARQPQG